MLLGWTMSKTWFRPIAGLEVAVIGSMRSMHAGFSYCDGGAGDGAAMVKCLDARMARATAVAMAMVVLKMGLDDMGLKEMVEMMGELLCLHLLSYMLTTQSETRPLIVPLPS